MTQLCAIAARLMGGLRVHKGLVKNAVTVVDCE
jgi:hypothetical protein